MNVCKVLKEIAKNKRSNTIQSKYTKHILIKYFLFLFFVNKVMLEISAAQYYEDKADAKKNFCNNGENMPHMYSNYRDEQQKAKM